MAVNGGGDRRVVRGGRIDRLRLRRALQVDRLDEQRTIGRARAELADGSALGQHAQ